MESEFVYGNGHTARWAVELSGHRVDLAALSVLLAEQDPAVVAVEGNFYIVGTDLDARDNPAEAQQAASEIVELINGLTPGLFREFEPVAVAAHIREPREGRQAVVVTAGTARVRVRCFAPTVSLGPDGQEKDSAHGRLGRFLEVGRRHPMVQRAAAFLRGPEVTWSDLYRALEVIEEDLGQPVNNAGLCSGRKRSSFRGTANNFSVLGDEARHGRTGGQPPSKTMSLLEGRTFVLGLYERWLENKTKQPGI